MPCDSIVLNEVDLGKVNPDLLKAAIKNLTGRDAYLYGDVLTFVYQGSTYQVRNGTLVGPNASVADELKREVSREAVNRAAKRFGWQVRKNKKNDRQFTLQRRY